MEEMLGSFNACLFLLSKTVFLKGITTFPTGLKFTSVSKTTTSKIFSTCGSDFNPSQLKRVW